jgi:hypothetical protein
MSPPDPESSGKHGSCPARLRRILASVGQAKLTARLDCERHGTLGEEACARLTSRFNFYDFVGYVMPGAAGLLVLYLLYAYVLQPSLGLPADLPRIPGGDVTIIGFYLGSSYLFGQLIQQGGDWIERSLVSWWRRSKSPAERNMQLWAGQHFALEFLTKDSGSAYPDALIQLICDTVSKTFGFKPGLSQSELKTAYDLCRVAVYERDPTGRPEIFLGIGGLSRAMVAVSALGFVVTILIAWQQVGWLAPIGAALFLLTGVIWTRRFQAYSRMYANSVLHTFVGAYGLSGTGIAGIDKPTGGPESA